MDKQKATAIARPLMQYAYQHGLHTKIKVNALGSSREPVQRIGVALLRPGGGGGYRVNLPLADIETALVQPDAGHSPP